MICKALITRFDNVNKRFDIYKNVGLSESKEFPEFVDIFEDGEYLKTINKTDILEYEEDRSSTDIMKCYTF